MRSVPSVRPIAAAAIAKAKEALKNVYVTPELAMIGSSMRRDRRLLLGLCSVLLGIVLVSLVGGCKDRVQASGENASGADRDHALSDLEYLQRESASGNPQAQLWLAYANMVSDRGWMADGPFEWQALSEEHRKPWIAASNLVASGDFHGSGKDGWKLLQQAVAAKEPRAIALFAKLLANGGQGSLHIEKQTHLALEKAKIAAEKGDPYGRYLVAWLRLWGPERLRDVSEAMKEIRALADSTLFMTEVMKGWMYAGGWGYERDGAKARQIAESWAEKGSLEGKWLLYRCYFDGIGGPKDLHKAFEICREFAEKKYPQAMSALGDCYLSGWGVEKDEAKAVEWWKKAALDWPAAVRSIGWAYANGRGVKKSPWDAWAQFLVASGKDDVADVDLWSRKYREAKLNPNWRRSIRKVRVTAKSLFDERTPEQLQKIAERVVQAEGLQVDSKAAFELAFHCSMYVSRDLAQWNQVSCVVELKTHTPVLIRGKFINAEVAVQFGMAGKRLDLAPPFLNIDRAIGDQFRIALKEMMQWDDSKKESDETKRAWQNDLWPQEKDREMYCRWHAARALGFESLGPALAGFTDMDVPAVLMDDGLKGYTDLKTERLELDWSGALRKYGLKDDRESPNYVLYAAIGNRYAWGFSRRFWWITTYLSLERKNVVIELPSGDFARVSGGLATDVSPQFVSDEKMPSFVLAKQITRMASVIGPAIQKQSKMSLEPKLVVGGER